MTFPADIALKVPNLIRLIATTQLVFALLAVLLCFKNSPDINQPNSIISNSYNADDQSLVTTSCTNEINTNKVSNANEKINSMRSNKMTRNQALLFAIQHPSFYLT